MPMTTRKKKIHNYKALADTGLDDVDLIQGIDTEQVKTGSSESPHQQISDMAAHEQNQLLSLNIDDEQAQRDELYRHDHEGDMAALNRLTTTATNAPSISQGNTQSSDRARGEGHVENHHDQQATLNEDNIQIQVDPEEDEYMTGNNHNIADIQDGMNDYISNMNIHTPRRKSVAYKITKSIEKACNQGTIAHFNNNPTLSERDREAERNMIEHMYRETENRAEKKKRKNATKPKATTGARPKKPAAKGTNRSEQNSNATIENSVNAMLTKTQSEKRCTHRTLNNDTGIDGYRDLAAPLNNTNNEAFTHINATHDQRRHDKGFNSFKDMHTQLTDRPGRSEINQNTELLRQAVNNSTRKGRRLIYHDTGEQNINDTRDMNTTLTDTYNYNGNLAGVLTQDRFLDTDRIPTRDPNLNTNKNTENTRNRANTNARKKKIWNNAEVNKKMKNLINSDNISICSDTGIRIARGSRRVASTVVRPPMSSNDLQDPNASMDRRSIVVNRAEIDRARTERRNNDRRRYEVENENSETDSIHNIIEVRPDIETLRQENDPGQQEITQDTHPLNNRFIDHFRQTRSPPRAQQHYRNQRRRGQRDEMETEVDYDDDPESEEEEEEEEEYIPRRCTPIRRRPRRRSPYNERRRTPDEDRPRYRERQRDRYRHDSRPRYRDHRRGRRQRRILRSVILRI